MATKVTDVSSNNPATYQYIKGLYDQGSRFNFVKLTQSDNYLNSSASSQVVNTLKVFNNHVGVYHYVDSGSSISAQAQYFVCWLKRFGFDKTTNVMLDVEDSGLSNVTANINQFLSILRSNGYTKLFVYFMDNWATIGKIKPQSLENAYIWIASYGAQPKHKHDVWQYQGLGTQDWELDYTGELNCKNVSQVKVKTYLEDGNKFQVIAKDGLNGFSNKELTKAHYNRLAKDSVVYGKVIKVGTKTSLKTGIGYFSTNSNYLKKIE